MTLSSATKIYTTALCILAYLTQAFLTAIKPQSLIFEIDYNHNLTSQPNIKSKFIPVHTTKAHGKADIQPKIISLSTRFR